MNTIQIQADADTLIVSITIEGEPLICSYERNSKTGIFEQADGGDWSAVLPTELAEELGYIEYLMMGFAHAMNK